MARGRRQGARRALAPARTLAGGRAALLALSFDSDHETGTLREGSTSPGRLSQGQYGSRARAAHPAGCSPPRHQACFFVPAVVALLYPDEQRAVVDEGHEIGIHGWIHELTSQLPREVERDLMRAPPTCSTKIAGRRPVGIRTPSWDFSPNTLALSARWGCSTIRR